MSLSAQTLLIRHLLWCRDVSDLLEEQIELYRSTKQSILQDLPEEAFQQMTPQARERALQQEMKSVGTLHPALHPADKGPFTGHYKVLFLPHPPPLGPTQPPPSPLPPHRPPETPWPPCPHPMRLLPLRLLPLSLQC